MNQADVDLLEAMIRDVPTKRELFAAMVMQRLIAISPDAAAELIAKTAVELADALLDELEK